MYKLLYVFLDCWKSVVTKLFLQRGHERDRSRSPMEGTAVRRPIANLSLIRHVRNGSPDRNPFYRTPAVIPIMTPSMVTTAHSNLPDLSKLFLSYIIVLTATT